ncbi:1,4-dihydroxy-2-naphthoate octaprenyltransferase [Pyrofollis japonicus]|uniref:prenyltransferase n=1 Tax=Pyrofollis japonicus TaxID=3060460 RepID=UPI00295B6A9A|nr:prenyltransferase [Pyrofollis japonicus]BEP17772.1 1,4-dihydroxy-2-naphthoate octaprenyltransferase [Pyrofollis japonicus]
MGLGGLLIATRPWSFPMTILLSIVVALYATIAGYAVNIPLVIVAIAGSVLLHAAANVLNDYFDYRYGVDKPGTGTVIYRPHPIFANILTPQATLAYGIGLGLAGTILALITWAARPLAPFLALLGLLAAYSYTGPPIKAKYRGLGELLVYIAWGIIIPIGVFYMASGLVKILEPVIVSFPIALLIVGVLVANNLRDIETDKAAGFVTIATILGKQKTQKLFKALVALAYAAQALIAVAARQPLALLPLLSIPKAIETTRALSGDRVPPNADPLAAQLAFNFTVLAITGYTGQLLINLL